MGFEWRWLSIGAVLALAPSGTGQPSRQADGGDPQTLRLRGRLERNLTAEFAPDFVAALRGLSESRAGLLPAARAKYLAVEDGSIAPNTMQVFQWLNPDWEIDAQPYSASLDEVVLTIADFDRQLSAAGVALLVAPVPDRLMVYPELIAPFEPDSDFGGFGPGFTRFQLALRAAGVDVVDLLEPLARARRPEPGGRDADLVYLRDNSHWSPLGAAVAAETVAARLRQSDWVRELDRHRQAATRLERVESDRLEANSQGLAETLGEFVYDRVVDGSGGLAASTDPGSPIVLIGDSHARIFSLEGADFARHLHHRVGVAPDVIASPGGGALSSRRMLSRREDPLAGKRVVLWMFTVRALIDGPKQWRCITLASD